MEERLIQIEGFPFLNFNEFSVIQSANQHMQAKITGMIDSSWLLNHHPERLHNQPVTVWINSENNQKTKWLAGFIEDIRFYHAGGMATVSLAIVSHSKKSDRQKHTRTFQDASYTYNDVVDILSAQSEDLNVLILGDSGMQQIDTLLVQYEETDWAFLKRLASQLHTYLYPCEYLEQNGIYMGSSVFGKKYRLDTPEYSVCKDMNEYYTNQVDSTLDYDEQSAVCYRVTSHELYHLRDGLCLNGTELYIFAMESRLNGALLEHTYTLKASHGFQTRKTYNRSLVGVALTGTIHAVKKEMVQIQVNDDIAQRQYRWFDYSTVYSSPTNTGWYFMPETGDQVRLSFPSEHEADSYVISSVHLGERDDPDIKSIRTCYQKEIVFAPDSIHISNGFGSHITLDDHNGILIHSDHKIKIESERSISIAGQNEVTVLGDEGITIQQNENCIIVDDTIDISAGRLRMR